MTPNRFAQYITNVRARHADRPEPGKVMPVESLPEHMGTTRSPTAADTGPSARKATLFCPVCDHHSPVDGDWRVRRADGEERYACPDCGETVVTRPAPPEPDGDPEPEPVDVPAGANFWRTSVEGWHRVTVAWLDVFTPRAQ
jgi:hypothetical protein